MVDDRDGVDEFEEYESLKDRVRRGPLLGVLLWTTIIGGAVWVVLNTIIQIRMAHGWSDLFESAVAGEIWIWVQAVSAIANTVFLAALGSYVVLWLALRDLSRDATPS